MDLREYQLMAAVEDRHFWFLGMRAIFRDAYRAAGLGPDSEVLDVGCATGGMMRFLSGEGRFTGLDRSEVAAGIARQRTGCPVVVGDATAMPFPDARFDGVMAMDVLEHIEDDRSALREIRRVLRPGGPFLASVPCHPWLFSTHDRALQHLRRYRRREFLERLAEAGFSPDRVSWTNSLLFPLAAASRLARRVLGDRRDGRSDVGLAVGPANDLLLSVFRLERALGRRVPMPWGLSLLVVSR
ncbi:MAG TPA: class I SAM-dependent methyltransferase [Myxococcota bacterium]|nr:class I SAM-dependent methyltransferase [Myxococcota bacterium]HQK51159.1 class I SAM-dependent methyltransferase [Myxococcota bacterium]